MQGVACFDCHVNGHTSAATHLVGDIRPQSHRRRIDTPSLRGVNIQRLFGSQRALKTIEDFTEFEQRAAYFDGDQVSAAAKGINPLERGSQVHFMAEVQELLDFPPAPGLGWDGKLDPKKFAADSPEMQGQTLFFGKAQCATCHPAPFYTDNLMHDLKVDRFYKTQTINGLVATSQGPIKTFPLRGIKESPPYFHDGRLLTLEDTVEFFNLILETEADRPGEVGSGRVHAATLSHATIAEGLNPLLASVPAASACDAGNGMSDTDGMRILCFLAGGTLQSATDDQRLAAGPESRLGAGRG